LFAIVVLLHGQNHTSRWTRSMGVDHGEPVDCPRICMLWSTIRLNGSSTFMGKKPFG